MPDPRIITDYTPTCLKEERLKQQLHASSDADYRRLLQDRAIDLIHAETSRLKASEQARAASLVSPPKVRAAAVTAPPFSTVRRDRGASRGMPALWLHRATSGRSLRERPASPARPFPLRG